MQRINYPDCKNLFFILVTFVFLINPGKIFPQGEVHYFPKKYYPQENKEILLEKSDSLFDNVLSLKNNLSYPEQKISSDLFPLIKFNENAFKSELPEYLKSKEYLNKFHPYNSSQIEEQITEGEIKVYLFYDPIVNLNDYSRLIESIIDYNSKLGIAVVWVKIKNLIQLASFESVKKIQSVYSPKLNSGLVVTEGDSIHQTADVRATYGDDGSGIKIGVISNGVDSRSSSQSTGDLPQDGSGLTILSNTYGGDEGTAMLETIYDMVPGADLYFHDLGGNIVSFISAVDNLVNAGCNIICDDVAWITQPFFEDGIVAQHIDSLLNTNDILYVTPAGNNGISHYQGRFKKLSGTSGQHDFSGTNSQTPYLYFNLSSGGNASIILQWNDKFGSSGNDYDLYLYSFSDASYVAQSINYQTGNGDPLEVINYTATAATAGDFAIVVNKYSGRKKKLEVFIYLDSGSYYSNNISGVDAIFGHAALDSVITVGAVKYYSPDSLEIYSSLGPSTIKYPSKVTRNKPDLVAVDGTMITGAGGFGVPSALTYRFYGTSASVAHVTGVLAQVWSNNQVTSGTQAKSYVLNYSYDEGSSGYDNSFGFGLINSLNVYHNPLPVELSSFTFEIINDGVKLNWVTQTEVNNYGFEVERAAPFDPPEGRKNSSWEKIGFVEGHGNSNSPKRYSFLDEAVKYGNYLYRLKQVDNDGTYEYSDVIEVDAGEIPNGFVLEQNYPNPFNPVTKIKFAVNKPDHIILTVYDVLGEKVKELFNNYTGQDGIYEVEFNGANLSSGVYYYELRAENEVKIKKMLLLK